MTGREAMPAAERIAAVLEHLGVAHAHFGAQISADINELIARRPEAVSSLTLLCPNRLEPEILAPLGRRLLICTGDSGLAVDTVESAARLPEAHAITFQGYAVYAWSDTAAEHTDAVAEAMLAHLAEAEAIAPASRLEAAPAAGEIAGIRYTVTGTGPALVLLPLLLAPTQWRPLIARLARHFAVVGLGGPELGMLRLLETRGTTSGYLRIVKAVVDELAIRPGERVLDVGCGTGALDRWLARETAGANPITALDLNPFLISEARLLAARDGLGDSMHFVCGNAEALPFAEAGFDVIMSHTVMEECDADAMLAELIRVARPGGRVGVMVRGVDRPMFWNLELPTGLKARVEAPVASVAEKGCADASLYRRFAESGLGDLRFFPHMMTSDDPEGPIARYYEPLMLARMDADEARLWHDAKAKAAAQGSFLFGRPHHCAIGTKPA